MFLKTIFDILKQVTQVKNSNSGSRYFHLSRCNSILSKKMVDNKAFMVLLIFVSSIFVFNNFCLQ